MKWFYFTPSVRNDSKGLHEPVEKPLQTGPYFFIKNHVDLLDRAKRGLDNNVDGAVHIIGLVWAKLLLMGPSS